MPRQRLPIPLADLEESQSAAHRVMLHMIEASEGPRPLAPVVQMTPEPPRKKNRAAVALGRLGGRKGGVARAAALTPEQRKAIGKLGAAARWGKK